MAKPTDKNLKKLTLGAIRPQGWLLDQMQYMNELQKRLGMMPGLVKNGEWDGEEELPRYVRGIVLLSACLDDKTLKDKVSGFVLPLINSANEGGDFGPKSVLSQTPKIEAVKALLSYFEMSGDKTILPFLKKYFKNLFNTYSISSCWYSSRARLLEQIPAIEAVYRETDAEWLQDLGEQLRDSSNDWMKIAKKFPYKKPYNKYISQRALKKTLKTVGAYDKANTKRRKKELTREYVESQWRKPAHQTAVETDGTNVAKAVKYPAVYGRFVGDDDLKKLSLKMINALEKYHGTPVGMFSCDSRLAGKGAERGIDVQATVEMIESLAEVIKETGDFHCVDLLERIVYNAVGAFCFKDCSAVQDMMTINQAEASDARMLPYSDRNNAYITKKLSKGAVAVLSAYPLYLQTACMTKDDELNFLTYTPCKMDVSICGCKLTISERTSYPFRNTVVFKVEKADGEPEVKINFRVPKNSDMQLISGGQVVATGTKEISVKCILRAGSTFMLKMSIPLNIEENDDGTYSLFKGNVLMSLKVPHEITACADDRRVLNVNCTRKWNAAPIVAKYASGGARKLYEEEKTVVHEIGTPPLNFENPPFELRIRSKNVQNWEYDETGFARVPKRPSFSEETLERTYIPYACTLLHVAKFPKCLKK